MASEHGLNYVVPSARRRTVVAVCHCGWRTPDYPTSGLAESLLDAHTQREQARTMRIDAFVMQLITREQRATVTEERTRLRSMLKAIRAARPRSVDPSSLVLRTIVTVETQAALGAELAAALHGRGRFYLVGEARTADEAIALTVVEQPGLVVVGEDVPGFAEVGGPALVHELSPKTAVCIYGDLAWPGANLVVPRHLPVHDLVDRLERLAS